MTVKEITEEKYKKILEEYRSENEQMKAELDRQLKKITELSKVVIDVDQMKADRNNYLKKIDDLEIELMNVSASKESLNIELMNVRNDNTKLSNRLDSCEAKHEERKKQYQLALDNLSNEIEQIKQSRDYYKRALQKLFD